MQIRFYVSKTVIQKYNDFVFDWNFLYHKDGKSTMTGKLIQIWTELNTFHQSLNFVINEIIVYFQKNQFPDRYEINDHFKKKKKMLNSQKNTWVHRKQTRVQNKRHTYYCPPTKNRWERTGIPKDLRMSNDLDHIDLISHSRVRLAVAQ